MWGKQQTFTDKNYTLTSVSPESGCEAYSEATIATVKKHKVSAFLVFGIKDCSLANLIHNAQSLGANMLLIANTKNSEMAQVQQPDHIPGVQIHVLLVDYQSAEMLKDFAKSESTDEVTISPRFLEFARRNQVVSIDMTFNPDDETATKFLSDLYSSVFTHDYLNSRILVNLNYTMLHCTQCGETGFTTAKEGCLSGGRYCMKSRYYEGLGGEVMLVQVLKNICAERIITSLPKPQMLPEYWWTIHNSCMKEFSPVCTNAVLKRLGIINQVFACVNKSFETLNLDGSPSTSPLRIGLQDNTILRSQLNNFYKVQHFNHFPLIKINDLVYYGKIDYAEVMGFICTHINDSLQGCKFLPKTNQIVVVETGGAIFKYLASILVIALVLWAIMVCRSKLKQKFDGELANKIDQSVTEYLKRTGGSDL
jgi:hypothetical protein